MDYFLEYISLANQYLLFTSQGLRIINIFFITFSNYYFYIHFIDDYFKYIYLFENKYKAVISLYTFDSRAMLFKQLAALLTFNKTQKIDM